MAHVLQRACIHLIDFARIAIVTASNTTEYPSPAPLESPKFVCVNAFRYDEEDASLFQWNLSAGDLQVKP